MSRITTPSTAGSERYLNASPATDTLDSSLTANVLIDVV